MIYTVLYSLILTGKNGFTRSKKNIDIFVYYIYLVWYFKELNFSQTQPVLQNVNNKSLLQNFIMIVHAVLFSIILTVKNRFTTSK